MIELRGKTTVLRTLERKDCRWLWQESEPLRPVPGRDQRARLRAGRRGVDDLKATALGSRTRGLRVGRRSEVHEDPS